MKAVSKQPKSPMPAQHQAKPGLEHKLKSKTEL